MCDKFILNTQILWCFFSYSEALESTCITFLHDLETNIQTSDTHVFSKQLLLKKKFVKQMVLRGYIQISWSLRDRMEEAGLTVLVPDSFHSNTPEPCLTLHNQAAFLSLFFGRFLFSYKSGSKSFIKNTIKYLYIYIFRQHENPRILISFENSISEVI